MTKELADLIARLEKATGPDRELDVAILRACGYRAPNEDKLEGWMIKQSLESAAPKYTASLDAAIMLVSEGSTWEVGYSDNKVFWAGIDENPSYRGATAALALCIAALKARAASEARRED